MSEMRLAVMGAAGRMGQALVKAVYEAKGAVVAGGTETANSVYVGSDVGEIAGVGHLDIPISADPIELFASIDGVLDFTVPDASVEFAELAAQARIVHVIGTTGFNSDQLARIEASARHARIVKAGNMSLGVNLVAELTRKVAAALDDDFDIEIVEMHHRHKVDAPSGTALMLGEAAAEGRGVRLDEKAVTTRSGVTGARNRGDIGFATLRGGSVIGEHTIMFAGTDERIEVTHKAVDRGIFARGGVKAALWGQNQPPGLYSMTDVLGF